MADRPVFGTVGFYEAVGEELNLDEEWRKIAQPITFTFIFNYEEPLYKAFLMRFDKGAVVETAELGSPDEREADFVISGPVQYFAELIKGEVSPATAMATQKLRIAGKQALLLRHLKKLSRMLNKMTQLDPIFP